MDMESGKQPFKPLLKKYQYILLVLLIGIFLMLFPNQEKAPQEEFPPATTEANDLEAELSAILSQISGVGAAKVLLAEASGSETVYQMNTSQNQSSSQTVILMDGNREEQGLVKEIHAPVYRGAVIVCQGANYANVRLAVVEAVKSVTGLSADCITVLKMK